MTTFTYGKLDELLTTSHTASPPTQVVADVRQYDPNLNLEWYTGPDGTQTHLVYDDRNLMVNRRLGAGTGVEVLEGFGYDADGQLTSFTDGNGKVWSREYDGFGRLARTIDPLSNETEILYSESVVSPLAFRIETRHRNAADLQLARSKVEVDVLGRTASEVQDWWEGTVSIAAQSLQTSYSYDSAANVKTVTVGPPLNRVTSFAYDAAERLIMEIDPEGNETLRLLNRLGQPTQVLLSSEAHDLLESRYLEYDALGRTTVLRDALGNEQVIKYDAAGNATEIVDPEGHLVSVRKYDSLGRLYEEANPEGRVVRVLYDAASRPTHYEDALGNTTLFGYDALGREKTTTLPDGSVWLRTYDGVGNVRTWTDPNGTFVDQQYDALGRLTDRTATRGTGVIGPTTEHYEYDGLSRLTEATSGTVTVTRTYDSFSNMRSETSSLGGRTITIIPTWISNELEVLMPSGHKLKREFDALDQLREVGESPIGTETFSSLASYTYDGPGMRLDKHAGALAGSRSFDSAHRPTGESATSPFGLEAFGEQTRWTPRGLKSARARTDQNGTGQRYAYDDAGRLTTLALATEGVEGVSNNTPLPAASLGSTSHYDFELDPADNLLQRTFETDARIEGITTPRDGSGRNRPGSVNGSLLTYDANGNLTQKGGFTYEYDFRNRLTRISGAGGEIVVYTYDAFDRRAQKEFPATNLVEQTVWNGWQPVEVYRNGLLSERRVYGAGLDDIVALQQDTDGDGVLDATRVPWYDSIGNLVVLTRPDGSILERYDYTPMGEGEVRVDLNPPQIERVVVGPTMLEILLSEEANHGRVEESLGNDDVQLLDDSTGAEIEIDLSDLDLASGLFSVGGASTSMAHNEGVAAVTAGQTVSSASSRNALRRRLLFTVADPPAAGTQVTFSVAPAAVVDSFHNQLAAPYTVSFAWPAAETVLADSAPPRVETVHLVDGHVEVTFSEDPDASTVASAFDVGDPTVTWTASPDGFTYRSDQSFAVGTYSLTIDTTLLDRAGQGLAAPFVMPFELDTGTLKLVLYEAPDPTLVSDSTVGNLFGFHGLQRDPESGLYYARHRYYDPELGRFTTSDPLGYSDGPNTYQYALNDPVNRTDPMGLFSLDLALTGLDLALDVGRDPAFAWDVTWGTVRELGDEFMAVGRTQGFNSGLQSGLETFAATRDSGLTVNERLGWASKNAFRSQMATYSHGLSEARTVDDFHAIVGGMASGLTGWDQFSLGFADLRAGRRTEGNLRLIAGTGALASTVAGAVANVAGLRGGTLALSGRQTVRRHLWSRAKSQPSSIPASLGAARHPVLDRFEAAVGRNRGRFLPGQDAIFPNRRLARQAASEIAGNLGSHPVRILARDYRGGPWRWKQSTKVIGLEAADGTRYWRDDVLGHPRFGMGPHVNVGVDSLEFHLYY